MNLIESLKDAGELALKYKQMDIYEKLLAIREELAAIKEQNLQLIAENRDLKEALSFKEKLIFENGVYWIQEDKMTPNRDRTPICPHCYDASKAIFRLQVLENPNNRDKDVCCHGCKNVVTIQEGNEEDPAIRRVSGG